jgi:hypothetical protein
MEIEDVFFFEDGRTILAGTIEGHPNFVRRMTCVLTIDGKATQELTLDGEELPERRQPNAGSLERAVGTADKVDLTPEIVYSHRCQLREGSG